MEINTVIKASSAEILFLIVLVLLIMAGAAMALYFFRPLNQAGRDPEDVFNERPLPYPVQEQAI